MTAMKDLIACVFGLLASLILTLSVAFCGQSTSPLDSRPDVLYIALEEDTKHVRITATKEKHETRTELIDKGDFRKRSLALYKGLESRKLSGIAGQRMIKDLGRQVLGPFQSLIQSAKEIVFVINDDLLETPIDLFYHKNQPLFLQVPVSYRLSSHIGNGSKFALPVTALIVSDATADPERAGKTVATIFDASTYLDVAEINPEYLRQEHEFDLLLMSVHGKIDKGREDHITLGNGSAVAADFETIRPKLVYFDSCRLGLSRSFLDEFIEMGSLYFVAPILSNEAGNSSTKTMQMFFEHLGQGKRPELALFHTRKELWEAYSDENFVYRVWRAYSFRVYRLN
jgi:hypothetical protein